MAEGGKKNWNQEKIIPPTKVLLVTVESQAPPQLLPVQDAISIHEVHERASSKLGALLSRPLIPKQVTAVPVRSCVGLRLVRSINKKNLCKS